MYKTCKILLVLVCIIFISSMLKAQDHIIHGVVHVFDSIPLVDVEIKVKSTKQSFFTDASGNFIVFCNSEDKLKVTAKGFYSENIKIKDKIKVVAVNLKLKPSEKNLEYAIGYGHISERDKSTATATFNMGKTTFSKYSDMYDLIRGTLPGVEVTNGEVIIRGDKSFHGSSAALIVVDGVIMDSDILNTLSPFDVKSIHVIKDGSSSVYGSQGANGVVLIETRKGGDELF